jgi:hypothetical protein
MSFMKENFTDGGKVIVSEIFKVLILCERPTMELIVYFDWFLNVWAKGKVLKVYQRL